MSYTGGWVALVMRFTSVWDALVGGGIDGGGTFMGALHWWE